MHDLRPTIDQGAEVIPPIQAQCERRWMKGPVGTSVYAVGSLLSIIAKVCVTHCSIGWLHTTPATNYRLDIFQRNIIERTKARLPFFIERRHAGIMLHEPA